MTPIDKISIYRDILSKKLTAANSFFCENVAFYIVKQDKNGRALTLFAAYLYPSGHLITIDLNKDKLKERLEKGIGSVKTFMSDHKIEGI